MARYKVQVGWKHQKYRTKINTNNWNQAAIIYNSYIVHSGGKKRLLDDGKIVAREIT